MDDEGQAELQRSRLKKVQEKNKRAQARYRQKQKEKMVGFEERCHILTAELEGLRLAFEKSQEEKGALEMALKDPSMFFDRSRIAAEELARSSQEPSSSVPVRPIAQPSSGWGNNVAEHAYYNSIFRELVAKSLGEARAKEYDMRPFEYTSPDSVLAIVNSLVEELKERLTKAEELNTAESHKPVIEIIQAMRALSHTYREKQSKVQNLSDRLYTKGKLFTVYGVPRPEVWKAVLEAARLTPPQLKRILELRIEYLNNIDTLVRERKELVWQLQQATAMNDITYKQDDCFGKAVKLTEQLQESLTREHVTKEDFQKQVLHHVLSEFQEARMIVTAHPYHVDVAAMCDVLTMRPDTSPAICMGMDPSDLARSLPQLPAILQIPAVLDSDSQIAQDMYRNAIGSWSAAGDKNANRLPDSTRPMVQPFLPAPSRPQATQAFNAMNLQFNGGGRSSGFLPMTRQSSSQAKDTNF